MTLSDVSIKNPVFAVMLSAGMIVFGYLGYRELGISQFPEIDFPVVSVTTYREAADPETMDYDVTDIVEDAVSGVEGIDYIQSQSLQGLSVVTISFQLSRNVDVAMQDVQNAVAAAASRLPNDIDPPIISKVNFNKYPVIWLSIHGPRPIQEINDFVDSHLKQMQLPLEYHAEVLGDYAGEQAAQTRLLALAIAMAIAVFFLLQAAYGSWRLALLSFLTLPSIRSTSCGRSATSTSRSPPVTSRAKSAS